MKKLFRRLMARFDATTFYTSRARLYFARGARCAQDEFRAQCPYDAGHVIIREATQIRMPFREEESATRMIFRRALSCLG